MSDNEKISCLKKIKWKSNLTRRVEDFRSVISNDENFEKYFGKEYIEKLTEKSARLNKLNIKLITIYILVMIALYTSQSLKGEELRILGYGFKNIDNYKEIILFIAVIISPISTILSVYIKYIDTLIKECIIKISPNKTIRSFYRHIWIDEYGDALIKATIIEKNTLSHGFATFLSAVIAGTIILVAMTTMLAMYFIQIIVIYDVAMNPISTGYFNTFVIVFALLSITLSWMISISQLPMPEVDYGNLEKLDILEKEDPEEYNNIMREIAQQNLKKESRLMLSISAISYLIFFSCISFIWYGESLEEISVFIPKAIAGAFFVMFFSKKLSEIIEKIINIIFFKKYPKESNLRIIKFMKIDKTRKTISFLIPVILTILYSLYTYQ